MQTMVRFGLSGAAVALASLPAFLMPACLSSSSTTSGADSGSAASSGGGSGGTGSGSGSSSGTSAGSSGSSGGGAPATCDLDDMLMSATTTGGYWFTYSDRTCPNSALLMADAAGTLKPIEGYASDPTPGADAGVPLAIAIPGVANSVGFREFSGGGESVWGAGFGFNLLNTGMNPFTVCTQAPCTGTPPANDAAVGFPAPYDASSHKGISFFAKSLMATATLPTKVRVQLSDKHTDPGSGTADAGLSSDFCNVCDMSNGGVNRCTNDFYKAVNITSDWAQYTVLFSEIATDTWTKTYAKGMFDPSTLYHVHFQLNKPTPQFDIQIACISWVD